MDGDHSHLFKVILIGDSGVGKSNLMTRYTNEEFSDNSPSTIGVEFMTKELMVHDSNVKVQIWDTAGQERFRAISRSIYHGSKGAMVAYDITNQASFDHLTTWLTELRSHVAEDTVIMLIGNKCDLNDTRVISTETAKKFAQENGVSFLETSAKDNTGVTKAFEWLVEMIYDAPTPGPTPKPAEAPSEPIVGEKIHLDKPAPSGPAAKEKKKGGCCGGGKGKEGKD